jgi:hypothetical protein
MARPGTFRKGNRAGLGSRGQLRSMNITSIIIQQLNEVDPGDPRGRAKLHRLAENLIAKATTDGDEYLMEDRMVMVKRAVEVGEDKKTKTKKFEIREVQEPHAFPTKTLIRRGTGDTEAIKEIINRVDGKAAQTILTPDVPNAERVYETLDEIKQAMLAKGIDISRLPSLPPMIDITPEQKANGKRR